MNATDAPAPQDYHLHTTFSDGDNTPLSVVRACASVGCKTIAITDHVDQHGSFAFIPEFRRTSSLASYIDEVDQLAVYAKEMLGVSVHPGIELSTTSLAYKAAFREFIAPSCTDLDIILIEGRDDAGPINVAIAVREILHDLGQKTLPVVISHPDFGKIAGQVEALVQNNIGLELNESKLSPAHKQGLDRVLETARSEGVDTPRFTLGSDAHAAADAGRVPLVYQHARARDLLDQLIWL